MKKDKPILTLLRQPKVRCPSKTILIYAETHSKLAAVSEECDISIVKLLKICVDFTLAHTEILDLQDFIQVGGAEKGKTDA
jgi:hypothetical protein